MSSSLQTEIFQRVDAYKRWRHSLTRTAGTDLPLVGFVPTMGALHEGHATLIRRAREQCAHVVVSIFVNPLQFGPKEDFGKYPRTFESDVRICTEAGVDAIFHPDVSEIYPRPLEELTKVIPPEPLVQRLCGLFRPGHFEGVATVVSKLFNIVEPTVSYFGEKDYQQLAIIRRMAIDLNVGTEVVGVPTVREPDGLALSSRNVYLNPSQRRLAPVLHKVISYVGEATLSGRRTVAEALQDGREELSSVPELQLEYLEVCDADSLMPLEKAQRPMVVLVAAKLGTVRLIDNVVSR